PNEQPDAVDGQRQKSLLDKKPRPRRGFLSKSPQNTSLAKSFLDYFHPMKTILAFLLLFSTRLFAGQTDTILVHSAAMNKDIKCVVIIPATTNAHWPVVYLLHGYGGNYAQWPGTAPQLQQEADAFGILFVCPDGGFDSWYFDSPVDPTI